jgi:hypothetical protein
MAQLTSEQKKKSVLIRTSPPILFQKKEEISPQLHCMGSELVKSNSKHDVFPTFQGKGRRKFH